jgi:hypothetical protein
MRVEGSRYPLSAWLPKAGESWVWVCFTALLRKATADKQGRNGPACARRFVGQAQGFAGYFHWTLDIRHSSHDYICIPISLYV